MAGNWKTRSNFRCVLHGSFRKHFDEMRRIYRIFTDAGIEVLAPRISDIVSVKDGFAMLDGEREIDPRIVELLYLHNLKRLGENGFSYFVNPDGYIGKSVSYELGVAQVSNTRCFFMEKLFDHPAYVHKNAVWEPEKLIEFIQRRDMLPAPRIRQNEKAIHALWGSLMVPGSVVAVGGIIEYVPAGPKAEREVLLVKTHKWGGRYSIVGGKVKRNERLEDALSREIKEETGLDAYVGEHICTFDQVKSSGYYLSGTQHIFVDKVARVQSKRVQLNDEAEDFVWMKPQEVLRDLPIEPNARHTLELYAKNLGAKRR
ncbi:MAG: NUDIX domain-containing protein [bacterium]|nr:NUDIX domain-containing protein [bacterium]